MCSGNLTRCGACTVNDRFTLVILVSSKNRDILYIHTHIKIGPHLHVSGKGRWVFPGEGSAKTESVLYKQFLHCEVGFRKFDMHAYCMCTVISAC